MSQKSNIAILYFSRTADADAGYKSWIGTSTKSQRLKLSRYLYRKAHRATRNAGFDFYAFDEEKQNGNSFGERIANAFDEVFSIGYDGVICVGSDCFDIDHIKWSQIGEKVENGQCVIGPDFRGGAYLIGLSRHAFRKTDFKNLAWQTDKLKNDLCEFCEDALCLEVLRDVNGLSDIAELLKDKRRPVIQKLRLSRLIDDQIVASDSLKSIYLSKIFYSFSALRAPPRLAI